MSWWQWWTTPRSAAEAFTPASLGSDLVLWLDADQITGLNDGDPVATWTDASPAGNDASQAGGVRPIFKAAVVNGHDAVRFDGVDDELRLAADLSLTEFAIYVVHQTSGDGMLLSSSTENRQFRVGTGGNNDLSAYNGTNNPSSTTLGVARTSWSYVAYLLAGTTLTFRQNGVDFGTGTFGAIDQVNAIGSFSLAGLNYITGDIAEIIVVDRALSAGEQASLEAYLTSKYGL